MSDYAETDTFEGLKNKLERLLAEVKKILDVCLQGDRTALSNLEDSLIPQLTAFQNACDPAIAGAGELIAIARRAVDEVCSRIASLAVAEIESQTAKIDKLRDQLTEVAQRARERAHPNGGA